MSNYSNHTNNKNELKSLIRFLSRKEESGYIFVYLEKGFFDSNFQSTLKDQVNGLGILFLRADTDQTVLVQMENFIAKHKPTALVIANLYELIQNKEKGKKILTEINFAREGFNRIKIPLVFWISEETFPLLVNGAPDLYSQRRLSTIIFELVENYIEVNPDDISLKETHIEYGRKPQTSDRLTLLKEQYEKVLESDIPKKALINQFVLPYLEELSNNQQKEKALEIFEQYKSNFDYNFPETTLSLARTFKNLHNLEMAIDFYSQYLECEKDLKAKARQLILRGDLYQKLGKKETAFHDFLLSKDIFSQLVNSKNNDINSRNGLGISYERLGNIYQIKGDLDKAEEYYLKSMNISSDFYQINPQSVYFKNGLGIDHQNLGDVYLTKGNLDEAEQHFKAYLNIKTELSEIDPQNVNFKNGLAVSHFKMAMIYSELNEKKKAKTHFKASQLIFEELVDEYPKHQEFQDNLTELYKTIQKSS